jgi:molecular chaperone HtpG
MAITGNISVHTENIFPIIKKFLYSDHEIFLRELVSNATDATLKLKHLTGIGEANVEYGTPQIEIKIDKDGKKLHIIDQGLGMTADEVEKYFPKSVGKINAHGLDDCKSLNNDQMIFMLFGTVKRLMKMVEEGNNNPPEPFVPKPPAPEPEPEGDDEGSAEVSGPEPEPEEVVEEAPEQAPEEVVETRAIKKRGRPKKLI